MPEEASVMLEVVHETRYRYRRAVEFGMHRAMFRPRAAHDLRVLSATLEVSPHSRHYWTYDVFSNSVANIEPPLPAEELSLTARVVMEHFGVRNLELPIAAEGEFFPVAYSHDELTDLTGFLALQYPDDAMAVREWVGQFLPHRGKSRTRDVLSNINEAIRADFRYAPREAMGTQSPARTLASMSGTCRDFALLMIEAARGCGLAARFVSGYIYDSALDHPPSEASPVGAEGGHYVDGHDNCGVVGSGATHAWLHVYLPGAGWVPFDPTNTLYGGTDLIRVAVTRTPEQAAPVTGSWTGDPSDFLGMDVRVSVRQLPALSGDSTT